MVVSAMVDKRVHQRSVIMINRRMAHQPRLLGNDQQVIIFKTYIKRNILAGHNVLKRFFNFVINEITRFKHVLLSCSVTVYQHATVLARLGGSTPAGIGVTVSQRRIKTLTSIACIGAERKRLTHGHRLLCLLLHRRAHAGRKIEGRSQYRRSRQYRQY